MKNILTFFYTWQLNAIWHILCVIAVQLFNEHSPSKNGESLVHIIKDIKLQKRICPMFDISTELKTIIKHKADIISIAYLFGSYAKGKTTEQSDIDLAVLLKTGVIIFERDSLTRKFFELNAVRVYYDNIYYQECRMKKRQKRCSIQT